MSAPQPPPRKQPPHARTLLTVDASLRDSIANCAGKAVVAFALAQIAVLQRDADLREEVPAFGPDTAPARPWQTFDNLVADEPEKAVTTPVTVATPVKMGLAAVFVAVGDLINATGKLPALGPLASLADASARESCVVRLMLAATEHTRSLLRADPMGRDLEYPAVFRRKLEQLVDYKSLIDPGADAVARLCFDFLKVIAWHAGVHAYEHEHCTLNKAMLWTIIAGLEAVLPEDDRAAARDALSFIRARVEAWEAHAAAKPKKAAPSAAKKPPVETKKAAPAAPAEAKKAAPAAPAEAKKAAPAAPAEAKKAAPAAPAEAKKAVPAKPLASSSALNYEEMLDELERVASSLE